MAARPECEGNGSFSPSKRDTPSSLRHQLNKKASGVIIALDKLQGIAALADLKLDFPKIVAIGPENCGKSSVLERLAHWSLFPRSDGICTRMPIELRLIHQSSDELKQFCLTNNLPYNPNEGYCRMTYEKPNNRTPLKESNYMTFTKMKEQVKFFHDKFVTEVNGSLTGIISDLLVLEIKSCVVVNLNLIDLPGIIQANREGEPEDIGQQTTRLTEYYLQQPHTLVLGVVSATEGFRTSTAMGLVQKFRKQADTIGVLTKADRAADSRPEAKGNPYRELKAKLDGTSSDSISLPMGIVATRNHDTYFDSKLSLDEVNQREESWFQSAMPGYVSSGKAGIEALADKLVALLLKYTIERWVPEAFQKIEAALVNKRQQMISECGQLPQTELEPKAYLGDVLASISQYWIRIDFANPERWKLAPSVSHSPSSSSSSSSSSALLPFLPTPSVLYGPSSQLNTVIAWRDIKAQIIQLDFTALFSSWIATIQACWDQPFSFAPPDYIGRFHFLRDCVNSLLNLTISPAVEKRVRRQLDHLFVHCDLFPPARTEIYKTIQHLLHMIFFEDVFLPALESSNLLQAFKDSRTHILFVDILRQYPISKLLEESPEWILKRANYLHEIAGLEGAKAAIQAMVKEAKL